MFSPGLGEAMSASVRLEARVLPPVRAWASYGGFFLSFSCPALAGLHCPSNTGTELSAGADLVGPALVWVRPFAGGGVAYRSGAADVISTQWVAHAGLDFELARWLVPRAELERSRFPEVGPATLVGVGLRIPMPGL